LTMLTSDRSQSTSITKETIGSWLALSELHPK
jgi:hypothetical protein